MKNAELVLREILYQVLEKNNRTLTQSALSKKLHLSLSDVHRTVQKLRALGAVGVRARNFQVSDPKKILYYWASTRNINKDIVFATRIEEPVRDIEKRASDTAIFSAYTAYKLRWNDVPADYSEVYLYGDEDEMKKRYPLRTGVPNVYILKKDKTLEQYGKKTTLANTFVDLWNIKEWYAREFVQALEKHINGILE